MNMQPMKLNNIQTGFKRILLTVATVFMPVSYTHLTLPTTPYV